MIHNKTKKDTFYLSGFSSFVILPGVDLFNLFVVILSIIFILLGFSTFMKRNRESRKLNRRFSSLKMKFTNVKQKAGRNNDYNWINKELEDDNLNYEDINNLNRK